MKFIPNVVSSKASLAVLKAQKHSPTLLFAGGVVGVVGTVVLASHATLKLDDIVEETNAKLKQVAELQHDDYSDEDRVKDKAILRVQLTLSIAKLYGPAVVLGVASIGMLAGSHVILNRRNVAVTAAYAAIDKGFREYRDRVIEDLGQEKDREYLNDIKETTVTKVDENGKKTVVQKKESNAVTAYGRLFHDGNQNWQNVPEYNLMFLRGVQNMANDRLKAKGYLFLNDVYDDLGIERTKAGCVVGWLDGDDHGDGYVDFGIFTDENALHLFDYVTGREGEILLDFNVDGVIYDKF